MIKMEQLKYDLAASLALDRSDFNRKKWCKYIVENQIPLLSLISLLYKEHPVGMRFSWLFGEIVREDPLLVFPIVTHCFERRNVLKFPGFKRSVAKMLAEAGIPEEIEGEVADQLFNWVTDPKIKVSVKVFSIEALCQLTFKYPDFKNELEIVIDDQLNKNTAAFRARAKKILKKLAEL
jgi:hypothetical protein